MTPDMREMMRSMSIVSDGAENFVNADDYLQPQTDELTASAKQPLQNVRLSLDTIACKSSQFISQMCKHAKYSNRN